MTAKKILSTIILNTMGLFVIAQGLPPVEGREIIYDKNGNPILFMPFELTWENSANAKLNLSFMLDKPAGKDGFITMKDENFVTPGGERFKIWGVNLSFGACFPNKEDAAPTAAYLARYGINAVRLHFLDHHTNDDRRTLFNNHTETTRVLNPEQLDILDFFVYELIRAGIYININLNVGSPDNKYLLAQAMGRKDSKSDILFPSWVTITENVDLCGDGLNSGGHGATALSSLGGTIRRGELISDKEIQHVLKATPWAIEYCYPASHRWPATKSDGYSARYRGDRPKLKIGALVALHKDADIDAMGFETPVGKKLATAARNYGIYIVEDSHDWGNDTGAWGLILEDGVQEETEKHYGIKMRAAGSDTPFLRDIDRLTSNLYIIDNNGPETIGGGCNKETNYPEHRLQPLLPECGSLR